MSLVSFDESYGAQYWKYSNIRHIISSERSSGVRKCKNKERGKEL